MYQGHLPDGSSVQRHSAGSLYPYVLYGQQVDDRVLWGVICPDGFDTGPAWTYEEAAVAAAEYRDRGPWGGAVHLVGDPVEEGLFVRTPQQELDARWSNMRDADFHLGPGARWTEVR